jgi:predicted metal-binding membrane protein
MNRSVTIPGRAGLSLLERGQLMLLACLAVLTIGAWALTVHQARTMDMPMGIVVSGAADPVPGEAMSDSMEGMDMSSMDMDGMDMGGSSTSMVESMAASGMSGMGQWTWDGFSAFFVAWAVMMAAMMFPAVSPLLLMYHRMAGQRGAPARGFAPTWVFAAGYLLVWVVIGVVTWLLVQLGIELGSRLTSADRETWAPLALGATLVVAGAYQFSPIKDRCLSVCQSPVSFLMTHWRAGYRGALRMGTAHGAYCLGCCWALFAVLVAAGVMSLAWMLLLTLIVFAEKVLPVRSCGPRLVGAAFIVLGALVAAGPLTMPWVA